MRTFFIDVWEDLREKRLLPVAIAVALALVAVPLVLLKSGDQPPAKPVAASEARGPSVVALAQENPLDGSRLDSFVSKDPFKPRNQPSAPGLAGPAGTPSQAPTGSPAGTPSTVSPGGATSPSIPTPPSGGSVGGGSTGGGTSGGGGTTGGGSAGDDGSVRRRVIPYAYVIDVKFGRRGQERVHRSVQQTQVLPNEKQPLLVFLGVTATRETAVFLVDSSLSQDGEGACKPSKQSCTFLYLRDEPDRDAHVLKDAQGVEYPIRLMDIERISLREARERANSARKARARRAKASGKPVRRFVSPLLVGLER